MDVEKAWDSKRFDVVLSLLKRDKEFPKNFDTSDLNKSKEQEKQLIEFTDKRNQIHTLIKEDNLEQLKSLISGSDSKLYLNSENNSAVFTAIKNKKFRIYAYLKSAEGDFKDENEKELLRDLSREEKAVIEEELACYFQKSSVSHIHYLISKSKSSKTVTSFEEKMKTYYEALEKIKGVSDILQVIQYSEYLEIVYDFDNDNVTEISPNTSKNTRGEAKYEQGRLLIAAGAKRTEKEILGTIAHEMAHMALQLIYENECNPYHKTDKAKKSTFEKINKQIKEKITKQKDGPFSILSDVYLNYQECEHHSELIVRVPQILAQNNFGRQWLKEEAYDLLCYYNELLIDFQNFINESYMLNPRKQIRWMNESVGEIRKIREHPLCFSDVSEIKVFLESATKKIFLVIGESSWLCILKILHGLYGKHYINNCDRYLVLKLQNFVKEYESILQNFFREGSNALIIQHSAEDYENEKNNGKCFELLKDLLEYKEKKKIIFAVHKDLEEKIKKVLKHYDLSFVSFNEPHLSLRDLDTDSQKKVLNKKISFQKKELFLTDMITDDKIRNFIDAETVDELISDNKIQIGSKIKGLASLDGAYANLEEEINIELLVYELFHTKNSIFVFEEFSKTEEIGLEIKKLGSTIENLTEQLLVLEEKGRLKKVKSNYTDKEFKNVCRENSGKDVYWIQKSTSCLLLRKLYTPRFYLERNFFMPEKIVINCKKLQELTKSKGIKILISNTNTTKFLDFYNSAITREEQNGRIQNMHLSIKIDKSKIVVESVENKGKSNVEKEKFEKLLLDRITFAETEDEAQKTFDQLKKSTTTLYWLKEEENDLIYKNSIGSLDALRNCIDGNRSKIPMVTETSFIEKIKNQKLAVISDDPGMGKTTTLTKISESFSRDHWIIKINLLDFLKAEKGCNNSMEYILIAYLTGLNPNSGKNVAKAILKSAMCQKNYSKISLLLLFDGFDEIFDENRRYKIISLLQFLREETEVKFLITTRPHFKNVLEDKLSTFALQFQPMDNTTEKEFIKKYFKLRLNLTLNKETFEKPSFAIYVEKFLEKMRSIFKIEVTRFIGTPLQLYLMLEDAIQPFKLWINQVNENCADPEFSYFGNNMLGIYSKFVNKKYEYFKNMKTAGTEYSLDNIRSECEKFHMKIAKKLTLESNQRISLEDKEIKDSSDKALACGIVKCQGNDLKFIHPTFLEYYAAMLFMKRIEKPNLEANNQRLNNILGIVLFRPEFCIIRNFLNDMFLEINCKKRMISSTNREYFKKALNKVPKKNISCPRAPYLDVLIREEHCNIFEFLIKLMTKKSFLNTKCRYGDSPLLYACRCNRKSIVNCIFKRCDKIFKKSNKQDSLEFFKLLSYTGKSKATCLHYAAFHNNFDLINLIFDTVKAKCYSRQIHAILEMKDDYKNTLLHLSASSLGQFFSVIYEKLIKNPFLDLNSFLFNMMYQGQYGYIYPEIPYDLLFRNKYQILFNRDLATTENAVLLVFNKLIKGNNININFNAHKVFKVILDKIPEDNLFRTIASKDSSGCNALHYAVVNNDVDLVQIILERVQKIKPIRLSEKNPLHEIISAKIDNYFNMIHISISKRYENITRLIVEKIPKEEVYEIFCFTDYMGRNILHLLSLTGQRDLTDFILNKLKKSTSEENFQAFLFSKTTGPQLQAEKFLHRKNSDELNALHLAALEAHLNIVKLLLQYAEHISNDCQYNYLISTDEKNRTSLHNAILKNDNDTFQYLLELIPINNVYQALCFTENQGYNLLHLSACTGNFDAVKLILTKLLQASSSMENLQNILLAKTNNDGCANPLHLAALECHLPVTRILLEYAGKISDEFQYSYLISTHQKNRNAFHCAIFKNDYDTFQFLLELIPVNKIFETLCFTDDEGFNVLHLSAYDGNLDLVKLILTKLLETSSSTKDVQNILLAKTSQKSANSLHLAVEHCHLPVIRLLLKYAGEISHEFQYNYLMSTDEKNRNAFHCAILKNNYDTFQFLLKLIPINKVYQTLLLTDDQGYNVFHLSAYKGNCDLVKLVLNKLLEASSSTKNEQNILFAKTTGQESVNSLHLAVEYCHLPVVRLLLKYAEEISQQFQYNYLMSTDEKNRNAFHYAILKNNYDTFKFLLELIPVNKVYQTLCSIDDKGCNVLHFSIYTGNLDSVQLILTKLLETSPSTENLQNILIAKRTNKGCLNSLHLAVEYCHLPIIRLLFEYAGKISHEFQYIYLISTYGNNRNAFHHAILKNNYDTFQFLLELIPINKICQTLCFTDDKGFNVLHLSAYIGNFDAVKLIFTKLFKTSSSTKNVQNILLAKNTNQGCLNSLHLAVEKCHLPIIRLLLEYAGKISHEFQYTYLISTYSNNRNAFHCSILKNSYDTFKFLLQLIPMNKIYQTLCFNNDEGFNVLHLSAFIGNCDAVKLILSKLFETSSSTKNVENILLAKTANQDCVNSLHLAVVQSHLPILRLLLEYAGKTSHEFQYSYLISKNYKNRNAFHCAILQNDYDTFKFLLELIPINKAYQTLCFIDDKGCNVLHLSVYTGNLDSVQLILTKLLETSPSTENLQNILLAKINNQGCVNSLHIAVDKCHLSVVRILLQFAESISPEFQFEYIMTSSHERKYNALRIALEINHPTVFQDLLNLIPPKNIYRALEYLYIEGLNILHLSALQGKSSMVKAILDKLQQVSSKKEISAFLHLKGRGFPNAFDLAKKKDNKQIMEILQQYLTE